jgi:hypothetical protein
MPFIIDPFFSLYCRTHLNLMDRPPTTRGGHRRLNSIENDDWSDHNRDSGEDQPFDSTKGRAMLRHDNQAIRAKEKQTKGEIYQNSSPEKYARLYRYVVAMDGYCRRFSNFKALIDCVFPFT